MSKMFTEIATGRNKYSIYFLLIFMCVAPVAIFTHYILLDAIAWIMLIVLGFFIFVTGIVTRQEAKDSYHWPRQEAHSLRCSLNYMTNNGVKSYIPVIRCKFNVNGKEYQGTEYDFSASYTSKDNANEKLNSVKSMTPLLVYYKPSDPTINVINPGIHSTHYIRFILGALMVVMPILIWSGIVVLK